MLKVAKFGGSSLSDSAQFAKVKHIVESDDARKVVVVSAPGRRTSDDNKITDLLYLCKAHLHNTTCHRINLRDDFRPVSEIQVGWD